MDRAAYESNAMFRTEVAHLLKLAQRHRSHVTADGLVAALQSLLDGSGKAESVIVSSHPDFLPPQSHEPVP
jgi:hypothetical protein